MSTFTRGKRTIIITNYQSVSHIKISKPQKFYWEYFSWTKYFCLLTLPELQVIPLYEELATVSFVWSFSSIKVCGDLVSLFLALFQNVSYMIINLLRQNFCTFQNQSIMGKCCCPVSIQNSIASRFIHSTLNTRNILDINLKPFCAQMVIDGTFLSIRTKKKTHQTKNFHY